MEKKRQFKIFLIVFVFVSLGHFGLLPIKIIKVDNNQKKRRLTVTLIAKKVKLPKGSGFGFGYGKGPILKPGGIPDPRLIKQHRKIMPPKEEEQLKTIPKKIKPERKKEKQLKTIPKKTKPAEKKVEPLKGAKVVSKEPLLTQEKKTSEPLIKEQVLNEEPESAAKGREKESGEGEVGYGMGGESGIGTGYGIGGGEGIGAGESYEAIDIKSTYLGYILNKINKTKFYPRKARRRGIKGCVTVAFIVNRDGSVSKVRISKASKHAILNNAALDTIKRIAKFHPIPEELEIDEFEINVPFRYDIIDQKRSNN